MRPRLLLRGRFSMAGGGARQTAEPPSEHNPRRRSVTPRIERSFIACLAVVTVACASEGATRTASPEPPAKDVSGERFAVACANLRKLGCPEGEPNARGVTCSASLERASHLAPVDAGCLSNATDVDAVRACGGVDQVRVRCRHGD